VDHSIDQVGFLPFAVHCQVARGKVRSLLAAGVTPQDLAVITPYSAQVRRLRELLADAGGLEIDSVDGFQGREKEAVVLSLVRCNLEGEIGFLTDVRRTNVALTRARRALIVIGDSANDDDLKERATPDSWGTPRWCNR
jgi:superfamily I DNA and/or RNA helicase